MDHSMHTPQRGSSRRTQIPPPALLVLCLAIHPLMTVAAELAPGHRIGKHSEPVSRPQLRISGSVTNLCLDYQLTADGSFSIYQLDHLQVPVQSGRLQYTGPSPQTRQGQLILTNLDQTREAFFVLVENTNPIPARMVWIPPGGFVMGSPTNEIGREPDESPQHPVTVRRGFWLSKYETTQAEFQEVMRYNPSFYTNRLDCPVEMVTWQDAAVYCSRLTQRELQAGHLPDGYVYRLPTEEEWEYACRAGTTTRRSFGDDPDDFYLYAYGWYRFDTDNGTQPVGSLKPNDWGLYDMYGNVFEWCLDLYGPYPGGETIPEPPPSTGPHVYRGGSWYCPPGVLRSASRHGIPPDFAAFIGFRVALAISVP